MFSNRLFQASSFRNFSTRHNSGLFRGHGISGKQSITPFDRMIFDKINFTKLTGAKMFYAFAFLNVCGFGLSLAMNRDEFDYLFKYKADRYGLVNFFKSNLATSDPIDFAWTTAVTVGLGTVLASPVYGAALAPRLMFFGLLGGWASHAVFPRDYIGQNHGGNNSVPRAMMGFYLIANKQFYPFIALLLLDLMLTGPQNSGSSIAGYLLALTLL